MRTRPAPIAAALLAAALVALTGCAAAGGPGGPGEPARSGSGSGSGSGDAAGLVGPVWVLESIETAGASDGVAGSPTLRFEEDELTGTAGCHGFTSGYTLGGDGDVGGTASVTLTGLDISHSNCPAEIGDQETAVFDVLGQGFRATVDGDTLTVERAEGGGSTAPEARLVYRAEGDDEEADVAAIDGEWRLSKASDADGTMRLGGVPVTLAVDGTAVAGQAPCNGYTAEATVAGDAFAVGGITQTRMACVDVARTDLESRYLRALARVETARLGDGPSATLTLSGPDETLVFNRLGKKQPD